MIPYTPTPGVWRISVGPWLAIGEHDVTFTATEQGSIFTMKCYTRFLAIPQISTLDSDCSLASVFIRGEWGLRSLLLLALELLHCAETGLREGR
jgi:hypothetical protein